MLCLLHSGKWYVILHLIFSSPKSSMISMIYLMVLLLLLECSQNPLQKQWRDPYSLDLLQSQGRSLDQRQPDRIPEFVEEVFGCSMSRIAILHFPLIEIFRYL